MATDSEEADILSDLIEITEAQEKAQEDFYSLMEESLKKHPDIKNDIDWIAARLSYDGLRANPRKINPLFLNQPRKRVMEYIGMLYRESMEAYLCCYALVDEKCKHHERLVLAFKDFENWKASNLSPDCKTGDNLEDWARMQDWIVYCIREKERKK
ncbi:hypothetical protein HYW76_04535 [Candidatus Pacearchaeota archaeon]|nr:hypothetical protein [Candidatus Pacearchaeota archaeon]